MSKREWALIGGIVILVAAAVVAVFLRPSSPQLPPASSSAGATSTTAVSATASSTTGANSPAQHPGWTTRTNTTYGYSIQYPSDWLCDSFHPTSSDETITDIPVSGDYMACGGRGYGGALDIKAIPLSAAGAPPQSGSDADLLRVFLEAVDANPRRFYGTEFTVVASQKTTFNGRAAVEQAERFGPKTKRDEPAPTLFSIYATNGTYAYRLSTLDYISLNDATSSYVWVSSPLYKKLAGNAENNFPANVLSTFHILSGSGNTAQ